MYRKPHVVLGTLLVFLAPIAASAAAPSVSIQSCDWKCEPYPLAHCTGSCLLSISSGTPPFDVEWEDGVTSRWQYDTSLRLLTSPELTCTTIDTVFVQATDDDGLASNVDSRSCGS